MFTGSKGFTLIELIVVIVVTAVIGVVALPRFLDFRDSASQTTVSTLFENFNSAVSIYQAACLARGGDTVTDIVGNSEPFNIDGIRSNYSGSCYPVQNSRGQRNINRPASCFDLLEVMTVSDYFDDHPEHSSTNPAAGGENSESVNVSLFSTARDSGYTIFIHQRRRYFSYCHFYSIEGDLSNAPFLLYNAVDGQIVTGTTDLTQNFTWSDELEKYSGDITQP